MGRDGGGGRRERVLRRAAIGLVTWFNGWWGVDGHCSLLTMGGGEAGYM